MRVCTSAAAPPEEALGRTTNASRVNRPAMPVCTQTATSRQVSGLGLTPRPKSIREVAMSTATRYPHSRSNKRSGGLWEVRYEPGPSFPWGVIARRSILNADGHEESTQDQELETVRYIKDNKLGRIVGTYKDIASGFHEDANRPDYENALDDLRAGVIGGIAVWKFDRLTRRIL